MSEQDPTAFENGLADGPGSSPTRLNLRSIALPTEHGGWGFTLEPILLGLLVASSTAAWEISVAALGAFLVRRPLKIVSTDLVRRRWLPRSTAALIIGSIYGAFALAGTVAAFVTSGGRFWIPVLVAAPLALVALRADAHSKNRSLIAEVFGATAMGATVAAIAIVSGWDLAPSFGLWLVLAARDVAAIALVRGQVRRLHGKPTGATNIYAVQAISIVVVGVGAAAGILPWLGVVGIGFVGFVALMSLNRRPIEARVIGLTQMFVGLSVVVASAAGIRLGW